MVDGHDLEVARYTEAIRLSPLSDSVKSIFLKELTSISQYYRNTFGSDSTQEFVPIELMRFADELGDAIEGTMDTQIKRDAAAADALAGKLVGMGLDKKQVDAAACDPNRLSELVANLGIQEKKVEDAPWDYDRLAELLAGTDFSERLIAKRKADK